MKIRSLIFLAVIAVLLGVVTTCEDTDSPTNNPEDTYYTVSFVVNGGSPAPQNQTVSSGGKVTEPAAMTKSGYNFGGWYKEAAFINLWNFAIDTVTGNITLYAKWDPPLVVSGETLAAKFQWLNSNAASNTDYIIEVSGDELIGPQDLSFTGKSNITIQLIGIGGERNIERYGSSYSAFFTIGRISTSNTQNEITLILNENIVLKGSVNVQREGNLIMNNGSKITDGSVSVGSNGTFIMNGGEITVTADNYNNSVVSVSGSYNYSTRKTESGTFTMNGGKISGGDNSGVSVYYGIFTMTGGEISGNTGGNYGGGVNVNNGTFTMTGGVISGNTAYSNGGGVYINATASNDINFRKTGGIITGYSSDNVNGNVVILYSEEIQNDNGHAIYVAAYDDRFLRFKDTTAGEQDNLSYVSNGLNPPTISGVWDE